MSEREIAEAIAEQEEHIKRIRSCENVIGKQHQFVSCGRPDKDISQAAAWVECFRCGVTKSPEDYKRKFDKGRFAA